MTTGGWKQGARIALMMVPGIFLTTAVSAANWVQRAANGAPGVTWAMTGFDHVPSYFDRSDFVNGHAYWTQQIYPGTKTAFFVQYAGDAVSIIQTVSIYHALHPVTPVSLHMKLAIALDYIIRMLLS